MASIGTGDGEIWRKREKGREWWLMEASKRERLELASFSSLPPDGFLLLQHLAISLSSRRSARRFRRMS